MPTVTGDRLLTIDEVADVLAVCKRTVWRLHESGVLPGRRVSTRALRWRASDVEAYIANLPAARKQEGR